MPDENLILDRHSFANEGMTGNLAILSNGRIFLNFDKCSDLRVVSDFASVEIARLDDFDPRAEFDVAHASLMDLRLVHDATPSRLNRGMKRSATSSPVSIDS